LVLERDALTMVVRHVPAEVCENCGEEYVDEATAAAALERAEAAARGGVGVESASEIDALADRPQGHAV
jgi:hypothetical protein